MTVTLLVGCENSESNGMGNPKNSLAVSPTRVEISADGGEAILKITMDADSWQINESHADWINLTKTSGVFQNSEVVVAITSKTESRRVDTLTITAGNADTVKVLVVQLDPIIKTSLYPSYNTSPLAPDMIGMGSTASELASKMTLGWNMGHSLEAVGSETAWGNPKITKEFIDLIKANGFNTIRIPCSWNQYVANPITAKIRTSWFDRVQEVVDYCVDNEMYVFLNIHWDGGWLENNCTVDKQEANNAKQKAFWEQIATRFRDYDEHLVFAGTNEPNVDNAKQMSVLKSYLQTFVDAVRSTGGKNAYRALVVQGPSTDIGKTLELMNTLPVDAVESRMMVEVHYYSPWNFCGLESDADWGKMFYYWGEEYYSETDTERNSITGEEAVLAHFIAMKNKFVMKGVPVILGEFAVVRRSLSSDDDTKRHLDSRAYYLKFVTETALNNGIIPVYWDNGGVGTNGSGLFDRDNNTVADQQALDALNQGAGTSN
ncbi:MAG: cellulase family glycosylhydrolase [Bacteroidales bacterium]|nr:cellulase family glycosylhydrolase [Bacteroidales bacterium]